MCWHKDHINLLFTTFHSGISFTLPEDFREYLIFILSCPLSYINLSSFSPNANSQGAFTWTNVFWSNLHVYLQCRCPHLNSHLKYKDIDISKALPFLSRERCLKSARWNHALNDIFFMLMVKVAAVTSSDVDNWQWKWGKHDPSYLLASISLSKYLMVCCFFPFHLLIYI